MHGAGGKDQDQRRTDHHRVAREGVDQPRQQLIAHNGLPARFIEPTKVGQDALFGIVDLDRLHGAHDFTNRAGYLGAGRAAGDAIALYAVAQAVGNQDNRNQRGKDAQRNGDADLEHGDHGDDGGEAKAKEIAQVQVEFPRLVYILTQGVDHAANGKLLAWRQGLGAGPVEQPGKKIAKKQSLGCQAVVVKIVGIGAAQPYHR